MKILFFSHDAEFNGAQMMLKYLFLKMDKASFEAEVIILKDGKVFDDAGVKVHLIPKREKPSFFKRIINKLLRIRHRSDEEFLKDYITSIHQSFKPDLWYINSIATPPHIFSLACTLNAKFVVHFHELPYYYASQTKESLKNLVTKASLVIGCGEKVCENIKIMGGRNVEKINEFIDFSRIRLNIEKQNEIRQALKIPKNAFIWAMSGGSYYRKGADFIPQILSQFKNDNVHFMWIGNVGDTGYNYFVEKSIESKQIKNIHFVGARKDDYYDYLSACNGFLLTSREDPFPLVMIEAAAVGKPIVSFDSGGISEFLTNEMGIVIDTWGIEDLAHAMRMVMDDQINFSAAKAMQRAKEFDAGLQVKNWEIILKKNFL